MTEIGTFHGYVDRGAISAYDFQQSDLTTDEEWHDLDLSAIVPTNAKLVHLRLELKDDSVGAFILLRKKGSSDNYNNGRKAILVADLFHYESEFVALGPGCTIQYLTFDTTWTNIRIAVRGWFI